MEGRNNRPEKEKKKAAGPPRDEKIPTKVHTNQVEGESVGGGVVGWGFGWFCGCFVLGGVGQWRGRKALGKRPGGF